MRKANLNDVSGIRDLIRIFALKGAMLPRSINQIYENIRDFWVVEEKGEIIACVALHPMWENMAEIKSLAVKEEYQKTGLGVELINACLKECPALAVEKVFALTYVSGFFEKLGFQVEKKETLPHKIWSECINCPHFPDCDEVLMLKEL